MIIKQLSIFVENKPGRLAEITEAIGYAGINTRASSIADTTDFGILRLIADKPEQAVLALKEKQVTVALTDVIAVRLDDTPGAFAKVVRLLSDNGINLEYMYAFVSRVEGQAVLILRVEEIDRAIQLLQKNNIELMTSQDVYDV